MSCEIYQKEFLFTLFQFRVTLFPAAVPDNTGVSGFADAADADTVPNSITAINQNKEKLFLIYFT